MCNLPVLLRAPCLFLWLSRVWQLLALVCFSLSPQSIVQCKASSAYLVPLVFASSFWLILLRYMAVLRGQNSDLRDQQATRRRPTGRLSMVTDTHSLSVFPINLMSASLSVFLSTIAEVFLISFWVKNLHWRCTCGNGIEWMAKRVGQWIGAFDAFGCSSAHGTLPFVSLLKLLKNHFR